MSKSKILPGAARRITLSQDMAILINNPQNSDIEFKIGKTTGHKSEAVTLYAHSVILRCRSRYFAAVLDEEKHWKENSKSVIYKPNISPKTFQDVIRYIYTGSVRARNSANFFELLTAADEMELGELNIACQAELMRTVNFIFLGKDESEDESEIGEISEGSTDQCLPDVAIQTHIIPVLNIASNHSLSHLSEKVLTIILSHMSVITKSPDLYTKFVNGISSEVLVKILQSNNLALKELSVWDLALSWACHQSNLAKTAVEARLKKINDADDEDVQKSDDSIASMTQLKQLKTVLAPLLPAVRFSLFENKDYAHMVHILNYFLPSRRSLEIKKFFIDPNYTEELDSPRIGISPSLIVRSVAWKLLKNNILETGGIVGCTYLKDFNFELLFRASEHGFLAQTFHQRCDNKGPTLTIVKSTDEHIFGGVNFIDWSSNGSYSNCSLNFLFALPDRQHRKDSAIFRVQLQCSQNSAYNCSNMGPSFGAGPDLRVANYANSQYSSSNLSQTYNGSGAPSTALAGVKQFYISDYEVFAISKK